MVVGVFVFDVGVGNAVAWAVTVQRVLLRGERPRVGAEAEADTHYEFSL